MARPWKVSPAMSMTVLPAASVSGFGNGALASPTRFA